VETRTLPIGLHLSRAARIVSQAFDEALGAAGGSLPVWLVLLTLTVRRPANQRELAAGVGIGEATLTHHLNAMERGGLITRTRDAANRRIHVVTLTPAGQRLFEVLREAATSFDRRLTRGVAAVEKVQMAQLLDQLVANVGGAARVTPPWAVPDRPGRAVRTRAGGSGRSSADGIGCGLEGEQGDVERDGE
jgi:MarR family transcriptional regulator, transcriptional regulator for hemolysin